jgi:hypothetical protein
MVVKLSVRVAFVLVLVLLAGAGCKQPPAATKSPGDSAGNPPGNSLNQRKPGADKLKAGEDESEYPVRRSTRKYQDVHKSVKEAWFLIESSYIVVRQKFADADQMLKSSDAATRKKGGEIKDALGKEVDHNIFGVNDKVEQLFKDALAQEPDNPLNCAAYGYYLKARKRFKADGTITECLDEGMQQVDKAISMWPDESSFYMLKVNMLTAPHQVSDWFRNRAMEEMAIAKEIPQVRELLAKAEQYDPDNAYINYYLVQLDMMYTNPDDFASIRDEVLRQIRAGNHKPHSFFVFPPPLEPYQAQVGFTRLQTAETEARFADHWQLFGHYDALLTGKVLTALLPTLSWPQDKDDIGELMYWLYNMGRTLPFDRSMFALQMKILDFYQRATDGSPEQLKWAEAGRFLTDQYHSVAQELYQRQLLEDSNKLDFLGVEHVEMRTTRQDSVKAVIQGPQAAYLKRAGEILGIKFPLPENPANW